MTQLRQELRNAAEQATGSPGHHRGWLGSNFQVHARVCRQLSDETGTKWTAAGGEQHERRRAGPPASGPS